jgi:hypothetical protein
MAVSLSVVAARASDVTEGVLRVALVGKLGGADPSKAGTIRGFVVAAAEARRLEVVAATLNRRRLRTSAVSFQVFASLAALDFATAHSFQEALSADLAAAESDGSLASSLEAACGCGVTATVVTTVSPTENFPTLDPTRRPSFLPTQRLSSRPTRTPSPEPSTFPVIEREEPAVKKPSSKTGSSNAATVATSLLIFSLAAVVALAACIAALRAKPSWCLFQRSHVETMEAPPRRNNGTLFEDNISSDDDEDTDAAVLPNGSSTPTSPVQVSATIPEVPFRRTQRFRAAAVSARAVGLALAPPRSLNDVVVGSSGITDRPTPLNDQEGALPPGIRPSRLRRHQRERSLFQVDRLCSICLYDLGDNDASKELVCSHFYHARW